MPPRNLRPPYGPNRAREKRRTFFALFVENVHFWDWWGTLCTLFTHTSKCPSFLDGSSVTGSISRKCKHVRCTNTYLYFWLVHLQSYLDSVAIEAKSSLSKLDYTMQYCDMANLLDARTNRRCALLCTATATNKKWWPFCSEQLQRQIIHQNARIFKRNWLIPWNYNKGISEKV